MHEVYRHTSPSGKSYVGWTSKGTAARWRSHCANAGAGIRSAFYTAIRKYGADAFTHEVLERMSTEAGAKRAEQLWIRELRTRAPGGYNLTDGGEGVLGCRALVGRKLSPSHLASVRKAHGCPEFRARVSAALRGHPVSPETRAKLSAAQRGRPMTESNRLALSRANKGRSLPPEVGQKISAAKKGVCTPAMRAAADRSVGRKLSADHVASLKAAWVRRKARAA